MPHTSEHIPTLEDYQLQLERDRSSKKPQDIEVDYFGGALTPLARTGVAQEVASDNAALDFFGNLLWGGVSGLTWGASGFEAVREVTKQPEEKLWDDMNDWEKAGWVTGEGLSLFAPFVGPFALLGRGGRIATKALGGNRYIRQAAKNLIEKDGRVATAIANNLENSGALPTAIVKKLNSQFKKQLPRELKDKYSISRLRDLNADEMVARNSEFHLRAQSQNIIGKILKDSKIANFEQRSRVLSKEFVGELKKGRYVNDAGEWVSRFIGRGDPGRVSKYLGMAANDYLYMGLHALGTEKIKSMQHGTSMQYGDIAGRTAVMALGFPLIRGIGLGGKESLSRGIKYYFSRYQKLNYKKMAEMEGGEKLVKSLLEFNMRGPNINMENFNKLGNRFWTVGGRNYHGSAGILSSIKTKAGTEGYMPPEHAVGLLNKMRLAVSKELTGRFRKNYFSDLVQSLPRMGTGILFMNAQSIYNGDFQQLSPQELSAHFFMGALMTKGRGAWDHAGKRGYISNEYGRMEAALKGLQVDHSKLSNTLNILKEQELISNRGVVYGHTPVSEDIMKLFDGVFIGDTVQWRNNGETISPDKYKKVEHLLGLYNTLKKSQDISFNPIRIEEMNPKALDMLKSSLGTLKIGNKSIDQINPNELQVAITQEARAEISEDYYTILEDIASSHGIPFAVERGQPGQKPRAFIKKINGPDEVSLPHLLEIQKIIYDWSAELRIDVIDDPVDIGEVARKRGMTLKDWDNTLGERLEGHLINLNSKHVGHNTIMSFGDNIFLRGLKIIGGIEAKDDLYKIVTNTPTDKQSNKTIRDGIINIFGVNGRLHDSIFANEIAGKTEGDIIGKDAEALEAIQPVYDLIKNIGGNKSAVTKRDIESKNVQEIAKEVTELWKRLPRDWQLDMYGKGLESFTARLFSGGNKLAFTAFERAREAGLIKTKLDGVHRIQFPDEKAIEEAFNGTPEGVETAEAVKKAVLEVKNLFTPEMVGRDISERPRDVDLTEWIGIAKEVTNSKVKDFVDNIGSTLSGLGKDGMLVTNIRTLTDLAKSIKSEVESSRKTVDEEKLDLALVEADTIYKTLMAENKLSPEKAEELGGLVETLKQGIGDLRGMDLKARQESLDRYGEIVYSWDQMLQEEMNVDFGAKTLLDGLLVKIHNQLINADPNVAPIDGERMLNSISKKFRVLLGNKLSKEVSLEELVNTFNESGNWRDAKDAIDAVVKQMGRLNTHKGTYDDLSVDILEKMQSEKLKHERPISFQEILLKYSSVRSKDNPNEIDNQFILDVSDAYDNTINPHRINRITFFRDLLDRTVYADIRAEHKDSIKRSEAMDEFKTKELLPLVQAIFGRVNREVFTLDHDVAKFDEKPTRYSLSTRTLDREGVTSNNPGKKYQFIILDGTMKLRNKTLNIDDSRDVKGNWIVMQNLIDNAIPVDMRVMKDAYEEMRSSSFKLKIEDLQRIIADETGAKESTKVYMRLSPRMRIIFPKTKENIDLLHDDFSTVYAEKFAQYDSKLVGNTKRQDALVKGFKHLLNQESSNSALRLKMLFVHFNRTMGPMFDEMMNRMDIDRGKMEFNSFKRGFLTDGGTTTQVTRQALEWQAENGPGISIRNSARKALRDGYTLGVINDEIDTSNDHVFRNRSIVKLERENASTVLAPGSSGRKILANFITSIDKGKYTSLESFFLDGNKIASTGTHDSWKNLKGGGDWNGMKTIIMDNDVLGKGFTVFHPEVSKVLDGLGIDLLVGKTVAKTLNLGKVTPFTLDTRMPLAKGWESRLADPTIGMNKSNLINIPYKSMGISFTTHSDPGVNYSSSMFDFQNTTHLKHARQLYKIDKLIEKMGNVNSQKDFARGNLLKALYQIRQEEAGQALTTDSYTLTEKLIRFGAREGNILVQRPLMRLLQSEFYDILSKRPTPHGEESIIAPDFENTLRNPSYANFINLDPAGSHGQPLPDQPMRWQARSVYQYGGATMSDKLSRQEIGTIADIPFIARDPETGLDLFFVFNKEGKLQMHSSFLEMQNSIIKAKVGQVEGLNPDEWIGELDSKTGKYRVNPKTVKGMEAVLNHLKDQAGVARDMTYGDLIHLLSGDTFPRQKRYSKKVDFALQKKFRQAAAKYDIQLGMSMNAIPKMLKDQPLMRVERILNPDMAGITHINTFDLRVTLQRDHDGDHAYKYMKMPMRMLKDYTDDMGDILDYKPLEKGTHDQMDMFGFGETGVAGTEVGDVGFDRVAYNVVQKKKYLAGVISRKGTLSYLLNSGIQLDGKSFVKEDFNKKNYDLLKSTDDALGIFQRSGEMFQASADIWQRTTELNTLDRLASYFIYGLRPSNMDKPSAHHPGGGFLRGQNKTATFGLTSMERRMFDIMHRTLSKARRIDNDVYEVGNKRRPTTEELRDNRDEIISFFKNPDKFLIKSLIGEARTIRKRGEGSRADDMITDVIRFFYRDVGKGTLSIKDVESSLKKGFIPTSQATQRFTAENTLGIESSMSGYVLDQVVKNPVFYTSDAKYQSGKKNATMFKHYENLKGKVETMMSYGDITDAEYDLVIEKDMAFMEVNKSGKSVFNANQGGILRFLANSQHEKAVSALRHLNNESFPDANKIEKIEDKIATTNQVVNVLDRQLAKDLILRKDSDLVMKFIPKSEDNSVWDYRALNLNGNLYRVAGQVSKDDLKSKSGIQRYMGTLEYVGTVNMKQRTRLLKGSTYIIDKRPAKFVSINDGEAKWNRALAKVTRVGSLNAEYFYNENTRTVELNDFIQDVTNLRRAVSNNYSLTREAVKEDLVHKNEIYYRNNIFTERAIDRFFSKHGNSENFADLVDYVIQPQIQRNVYYKDGPLEMPYYKANTHLIESVYNWLGRPHKVSGTNAARFNHDADILMRSTVRDMNNIYDGRTSHVENRTQDYNRMRKEGPTDWDKLIDSTSDILMNDWYHSPTLSKYRQRFFLGRGKMIRRFDHTGKSSIHYNYRRTMEPDGKYELIKDGRCG
tara:strand:- start:2271 stop:11183 length:8913 start_codon:yes stop_codon:yes gene_type:complete